MLLTKSDVSARRVSASSSLVFSYRSLAACAHSHALDQQLQTLPLMSGISCTGPG